MAAKTKGRPPKFTKPLARKLCERLAEGRTLRDVCRDDDIPVTEATVREWAMDDREGFSAQYSRAREVGYHSMADEIMEISDDGTNDWIMRQDDDDKETYVMNGEHVQRSRLRVDTRKWALSKALPKIYGDKVSHEVNGKDGGPIQVLISKDDDKL